jgi:hypothetical protein
MIGSPLFSCPLAVGQTNTLSNGKIYMALYKLRLQVVDSMRSRLVFVLPLLF